MKTKFKLNEIQQICDCEPYTVILITFYSTTLFKVYNWFKVCNVIFKTHVFRYSFNTHISGAVSTHTFQLQFQHAHFKCGFNTHISSAVSTHTFQVQFQHTHFKRKLQHAQLSSSSRQQSHLKIKLPLDQVPVIVRVIVIQQSLQWWSVDDQAVLVMTTRRNSLSMFHSNIFVHFE